MTNSFCENCQNYIDLDEEPEHEKMCKETNMSMEEIRKKYKEREAK